MILSNIGNAVFSPSFLWEIIKLEAKHVMNIKNTLQSVLFLLEKRGNYLFPVQKLSFCKYR